MPLDPEQITQTGVNPYDNGAGDGGDTGDPLGSGPTAKPYVFNSGEIGYQIGSKVYHADGTLATSDPYVSHATGGSTTVVNASTGGAHYSTFYGPQGYGTYETSSGVPILIGLKEDPSNSYTNPLDKNNDGLNDSTGWANGVFKDSSSPSGFYYASNGQYIPVTPDGAPYNGPDLSGGGANAKTWTGQGPKGYGTYYLDGPNGTPGTFIGDTRAPSSAASSGTPRISSGSSGGGSSSGSSAALSAQISADASAARQAADIAFQGSENQKNRDAQARAQALQRQYDAAALNAQLQRQWAADQVAKTDEYLKALNSTSPLDFAAFLDAGGGNISNALASGATALGNDVLLGGARAKQSVDQPFQPFTWNEPGATGGLATGGSSGAGGLAGDTGSAGGTTGGTGDTTATGGSSGGSPQVTLTSEPTPVYGQRTIGSSPSGGWEIDPTTGLPAIDPTTGQMIWNPALGASMPTVTGGASGFGNFDLGQQIGQPMTAGQRSAIGNTAYGNYAGGVLGDQRPISVTNAQVQNALGTSQPTPGPTVTPGTYNTVNTAPAGTQVTGGVANGTHIDAATGRLVPNQPVPQATVPQVARMASGGAVGGLARGPLMPTLMGDTHSGRMSGHEELGFLAPGSRVFSHEQTQAMFGGAGGLQRALRGGMTRAATGGQWMNTVDGPVWVPDGGNVGTAVSGGYAPAQPAYGYTGGSIGGYTQPQPQPAPVQQPSGGTVSSQGPTPPVSPTTATGGLATSVNPAPTTATGGAGGLTSATAGNASNSTSAASPSTVTPTPVAPAPTTASSGAMGGLASAVPTSGYGVTPISDLSQLGATAMDQQYMQQIAQTRNSTQIPNLNPYAIDYSQQSPTLRDLYEKGMQAKYGIPQQDIQAEAQRYQLAALRREPRYATNTQSY